MDGSTSPGWSTHSRVPDATAASERFLTAVGIGAGATVVLASVVGLPISTTHALVGAGLAAVPTAVDLFLLGATFLLPLILGPLLAIVVAGTLYPLATGARRALGVKRETCVCVGCVENGAVGKLLIDVYP